MPTRKIFVAGLSSCGKTELIKRVSDIPTVSVQKKITGSEELVDMDYGRVLIEDTMAYFYAPAYSPRISEWWKSLSAEMAGMMFLIDGKDIHRVEAALELLSSLMHPPAKRLVIGISFGDSADWSGESFASVREWSTGRHAAVKRLDATDKENCLELVSALLQMASVETNGGSVP